MEVDLATSEFIEHCMGTPTVLRKVLEQFSNRELLTLSFVSKQWNFEARSVLKDRGDTIARIGSRALYPCRSLVAFTLDLRKMRVVPFSGVHVWLSHRKDNTCQPNDSLDPSYYEILGRLPWKHVAVTFRDTLLKCENCQALKLVQTILEDFQGVLEELSLTFDWGHEDMCRQVSQHCTFPRLTTLKIQACSRDESLTEFVKALIARAPSLLKLYFNCGVNFQENVLEGSSAVLVPVTEFDPLFDRISENLIRSLRAETIQVVRTHWGCALDEKFLHKDIPMALQASSTSLMTFRMDLLFAVPLMCYGICLENVKKLEMWMRSDSLESIPFHILTLLKGFDFTRVFPRLEQVIVSSKSKLTFTPDQISGFVEQGIMGLTKTWPDRAVNISHLKLEESIWDSALPFWAQMFPHVKTLSVNTGFEILSQFPFTLLWENFVYLEEIYFYVRWGFSVTGNLDSAFCGIFPEEVAELMEKDDEYLKAVNIVPIMPSITCAKGRRTLTLEFTAPSYSRGNLEMKPSPTSLFSRVTALICFARCPALAVTFTCNDSRSAEALSHMASYVSFVNKFPAEQPHST